MGTTKMTRMASYTEKYNSGTDILVITSKSLLGPRGLFNRRKFMPKYTTPSQELMVGEAIKPKGELTITTLLKQHYFYLKSKYYTNMHR